jgi:hypothetical protein
MSNQNKKFVGYKRVNGGPLEPYFESDSPVEVLETTTKKDFRERVEDMYKDYEPGQTMQWGLVKLPEGN